jgi:hypothetical protein
VSSEPRRFKSAKIIAVKPSWFKFDATYHFSPPLQETSHEMASTTETRTTKCSLCKEEGHNKRSCRDIKLFPGPRAEMAEKPSLPTMEKSERVKRLKEHLALSKVNHEDEIMKKPTLKDAHVYCVMYGISAQQFGPLLERYIRLKFNYIKNKAEACTGDCSKDGENSEVKVSLGGANHTKFNFVQIRPSHKCESYILTAYNLTAENADSEGELYIFKVPKAEIKTLIVSYGGYAHGTLKEHGPITIDSLNDEKSMKEYALRPSLNDKCWSALMPFRIPETAL